MGENIIERVARVLCERRGLDPDFNYDPKALTGRGMIRWMDFADDARAAIAALREPSDAMIEAGERTGSSCCGSDLSGPEIERLIWTSMIDTALTEGTNHDQG